MPLSLDQRDWANRVAGLCAEASEAERVAAWKLATSLTEEWPRRAYLYAAAIYVGQPVRVAAIQAIATDLADVQARVEVECELRAAT